MVRYLHFGDVDYNHEIGNSNCPECWADGLIGICQSCKEGLVHNQFGDENNEGDYWLYYKCDKCGEDNT